MIDANSHKLAERFGTTEWLPHWSVTRISVKLDLERKRKRKSQRFWALVPSRRIPAWWQWIGRSRGWLTIISLHHHAPMVYLASVIHYILNAEFYQNQLEAQMSVPGVPKDWANDGTTKGSIQSRLARAHWMLTVLVMSIDSDWGNFCMISMNGRIYLSRWTWEDIDVD